MHPQTLRIYEARGLITPKRSPKNTRLYSQADVDRLQRIQQLTGELGMNLAGVEKVFEMDQLDRPYAPPDADARAPRRSRPARAGRRRSTACGDQFGASLVPMSRRSRRLSRRRDAAPSGRGANPD